MASAANSIALLLALVSVASIPLGPTQATVLGIDLGSQFMKMSVVRPGSPGIELVTNEQAKRKTPTAIAFTTDNERLFGDAAIAYAGKKPLRVLLRTREILGKCTDDAHLTAPATCPRLTVSLHDSDDAAASAAAAAAAQSSPFTFTGEEVTSMFITLARKLTAAHIQTLTGKPTSAAALADVVITVPSWFAETERIAVLDAATLAGMNPLATINVNTAAALKYTLDSRADAEKVRNETFLIVDVGSTGTTVSVGRVERGVTPKDKVKLVMMAHAWDATLGGAALDDILADHLADLFDEKRGGVPKGQPKTRDIRHVMNRLRREAMRLREVLSANSQAYCSVEALYNDIDFTAQITRKQFETLAAAVLNRIPAPIKDAVSKAGVKLDKIDTVIPYGGASRIPRVLDLILKTTDRQALNKSINADEAAVMGAAFYGATLSSRFQVRKIDVFDVLPHKVTSEIGREPTAKKQSQTSDIFAKHARIPSKKLMTVRRSDDFDVSIFIEGEGWIKRSTVPIGVFEIKGVAKVFDQLKNTTKEKAANPKVGLTFEVDRSGLVVIQKAEVTLEEITTVEREVPIKTPKKDKPKKDDKKAENGKDDTKKDTDTSETPEVSLEPSGSPAPPQTKIEKSQQTLVHRVYPTVTLKEGGKGLRSFQMNQEARDKSKKLLKAYDEAENARKRKADLLNDLEGFVLEIRGQLNEDLFDEVTSEETRENIATAFSDADDWLYTDESQEVEKLVAKKKELKQLVEPVLLRHSELEKRPIAVKNFAETVAYLRNATEELLLKHEEAISSHVEKLQTFSVTIAEAVEWMANMTEQQAAKSLLDVPAFTSVTVEKKIASLAQELLRLGKLRIPPKATPTPTTVEGTDNETNPEPSADNSTGDDDTIAQGESDDPDESPFGADVDEPSENEKDDL